MRNLITKELLGFARYLEITPERYADVVAGKKALLRIISIEEKFALVVDNYADYERTLLDLTLSRMLDVDFDYSTVHDSRHLVNRRLANLLTAARMYVDQVDRDIEAACDASVAAEARAARSAEYDSRFGYRVLEALRNHVQHHGLPVGRMSFPGGRVERRDAPALVRHGIIVSLDVRELESNRDFKPSVLAELSERGRYLPITPLVRDYVEGLAAAHSVVRAKVGPKAEASEMVLSQVMDEARAAWVDILGLCVVVEDADEEWVEKHDVFADLAARRQMLAYRTRHLAALTRMYVSSEPLDK